MGKEELELKYRRTQPAVNCMFLSPRRAILMHKPTTAHLAKNK